MKEAKAASRMRPRTEISSRSSWGRPDIEIPVSLDNGTAWYHGAAVLPSTEYGAASIRSIGGQNVDRVHFPNTSRPWLCRVAALFWRIYHALAQVRGQAQSASRHRDAAQLPLLWACLHYSRRRQS